VNVQSDFDERVAILELDGGFTRAEAEREALLEIYKMNVEGDPCIDLHAELWRAMRFARHPELGSMLARLRLPRRIQWGLSRIEYLEGSRAYYVPRSDGVAFALIVPVVEFGDTIDLAAIALPSQRVASRLGIGKALGLDAIDAARWNGTDLQLVDSPLAWLGDPDDRAFIVDWKIAAFTLADVSSVSCNSLGLATRVEAAFLRPRPLPELLVVT
jgi:hypothetical protein